MVPPPAEPYYSNTLSLRCALSTPQQVDGVVPSPVHRPKVDQPDVKKFLRSVSGSLGQVVG